MPARQMTAWRSLRRRTPSRSPPSRPRTNGIARQRRGSLFRSLEPRSNRSSPTASAGLAGHDPLRLLHREAVHSFVPGDAAVTAHVLESHPSVDEWIDGRVEVEILLAFPRSRQPVDDAETVGAHHDSPLGVVTDARADSTQRLADRLQLLAVV